MSNGIYVVVAGTADLESIKKRANQLSEKYGKCRIAKLQFIDA